MFVQPWQGDADPGEQSLTEQDVELVPQPPLSPLSPPSPPSPLQALRQRLGLGFGGGLSQQQIDELIARRKAQKAFGKQR